MNLNFPSWEILLRENEECLVSYHLFIYYCSISEQSVCIRRSYPFKCVDVNKPRKKLEK